MEPTNPNPVQPQTPESMLPEGKPSNKTAVTITLLIILVLIGVVAWVLTQRNNQSNVENAQDAANTLTATDNTSQEPNIPQSNSDEIDDLERDAQSIRNDDLSTNFESQVQTEIKD